MSFFDSSFFASPWGFPEHDWLLGGGKPAAPRWRAASAAGPRQGNPRLQKQQNTRRSSRRVEDSNVDPKRRNHFKNTTGSTDAAKKTDTALHVHPRLQAKQFTDRSLEVDETVEIIDGLVREEDCNSEDDGPVISRPAVSQPRKMSHTQPAAASPAPRKVSTAKRVEATRQSSQGPKKTHASQRKTLVTPKLDARQYSDRVELLYELPGVTNRGACRVDLDDSDILNVHATSRCGIAYKRSLRLPRTQLDLDGLTAHFPSSGVLLVVIPKRRARTPRFAFW